MASSPSLDQVMEALRNAKASGETKKATKLAVIANKMHKLPGEKKERRADAMPFILKGAAETLGAPVDMLTGGLNLIPGVDIQKPVGGSESIKGGLRSAGFAVPERKAENIMEHMVETTGEVSGFMLPIGGLTNLLSKGAGLTSKITSNIMQSIAKHPWLSMISEVTGGIGAGAGRGFAEENVESPMAKTAIELAGGMAGGMGPTIWAHISPTAIATRSGKKILKKMTMPFTKKGSEYRAGKYLKSQVADPEKVAETVTEQTIGNLPPAIASGEERLASLHRSLVKLDPAQDADTIETLSNSIIQLEKEMRTMGYGAPELLTEVTEMRIVSLELKMNNRVKNAMGSAQNKLDDIPIATRKASEAKIVRDEIETLRASEHTKVKEKWAKVPDDYEVGVEKTRATFDAFKKDLAKAQHDDIPSILKKSFIIKQAEKVAEKKQAGFVVDAIKTVEEEPIKTTLKEMQGLRSKLLEVMRIARKDGQWNKARIAGDMADSILDDIGVAAEGAMTAEASNLKTALAATKAHKITFESGIVGDLLGFSKSGVPRIDPALTLEKSMGMLSEKGAVNIEKITVTPEAKNAVGRYLGRSYVDYAAPKGAVNPSRSEAWIKNNEAILDQFPELRKQLTDATTAQEYADQTRTVMESRKAALRDPKISTSAKFLNIADLDKTAETILKDKNPIAMTKQLIRQAGKDPSGDALKGLKGSFVDHMLEKSSVGPFNKLGEHQLSGVEFKKILYKNKSVLKELFTPEQMKRIDAVADELLKIDSYLKISAKDANIEMSDAASVGTNLLSRIVGARLGGWMGKESAGGSLQMAQIYSGAAQKLTTRLNRDRALSLIHDAILSPDPELLKTLLLPLDKPDTAIDNLIVVIEKLNTWLVGTGKRVLEDIEKDDEQ